MLVPTPVVTKRCLPSLHDVTGREALAVVGGARRAPEERQAHLTAVRVTGERDGGLGEMALEDVGLE